MSRSARLLDLIQLLRRHRRPVTAASLAAELGISERTVYRDVATLVAQGVPVAGEAGLGYVLQPGFLLPPLNFDQDEIEALALGLRWVASRGDGPLRRAAADVLAKIAAVLPPGLQDAVPQAGLLPGGRSADAPAMDLSVVRRAIRTECKLCIAYTDREGRVTQRTVWPIAVAFFDQVRIVAAWCELRQDFRHFRVDRIINVQPPGDRYTRRRRVLLAEWRARHGIPDTDEPLSS